MSHVFEISDEQYERMREIAEAEGRTVEELFAGWMHDVEARYRERHPIFYDEDSWLRHLGVSEERIQSINAELAAEKADEESVDAHAQ